MRKKGKSRHGGQGAVLPLGIKNKMQTELPALVALTAIGEPWFSAEHQTDLLAVALVVREMAQPDTLQMQCAIELQRLCEQVITKENKVEIALNLAECLPWLQLQPNHLVQRALEAVLVKCAAVVEVKADAADPAAPAE